MKFAARRRQRPSAQRFLHPWPNPAPDIPPTAPAEVAPVALAYNTRTRIPYPRDAFQLHQQGTVVLSVLVGVDGVPQTVEIEKSSGSRSLDVAARDAVRHWTFQAGTRNGITTALWARVPIKFDLQAL
jgi:protein TonB